jgi:hypothetical protein
MIRRYETNALTISWLNKTKIIHHSTLHNLRADTALLKSANPFVLKRNKYNM